MRRADLGALCLAAFAGASIWLSLGVLSLAGDGVGRTGALPPVWLLALLTLASVAGGFIARLRLHDSWPLTLALVFWLPWIPLAIPAAFYVWDGPLEVGLWLVIAAGVILARMRTPTTGFQVWKDPVRAPGLAAVVFFAGALAAADALQNQLPGGDEPHYLVITQSLLYDGDLKIENNHRLGQLHEYTDLDIAPDYLRRGVNDEIYSVHAPGVSALMVPAFAIAGYPGAAVLMAALSAIAVAVGWRTAFVLTGDAGAAWGATAAVALSAPFFLHSFTIYPDPAGAMIVAAAIGALVKIEMMPTRIVTSTWVLAGSGLACLPWLHSRFALIAAVFGVAFGLRALRTERRARALAAFAAVPLLSAAGWFLSFYLIYGTINPSAPYGESRQSALEWIPAGLSGLVFDQQFGLGANAPVFALAPFGVAVLWRTRQRLAIEIAAIALPYALVVSSFGMWWGGWSAPARFLVALLPLAVPVFAAAWAHGRVAWTSLFLAMTVLGAGNALTRAFVGDGALLYGVRDGYDRLLDWASRTVNIPLALPSLHRLGIEGSLLLGCIWLLTGAVAFLALQLAFGRRHPGRAACWAVTAWATVIAMTVALGLSWPAARTLPQTPESSEVDFVQRLRPAVRPLTVRLPPLRLVTPEAALGDIRLRSSVRARASSKEQSLLALPLLPAGDYRLVVDDGAPLLEGTLRVGIGPTSQTVEEWRLEGLRPGLMPYVLRLPTRVHSVTIRGDDLARSHVRSVALRPERVDATANASRYALRGARYGSVRAFFLDDGMYMELGGIWTRGDATAQLVALSDQTKEIAVDVTAGQVATTVRMTADGVSQELALVAGQRQRLRMPSGVWTVTTRGTFRPRDFDPSTTDARPLGARLEFPR